VLAMLLTVRFFTDNSEEEADMSPARDGWAARPTGAPQEGARIVTTVEYLIDPARAEAFVLLMQESRRARLGEGAIGWQLLNDVRDPARFVEEIVDESWTEHLRRFHRATTADMQLRERRLGFHLGDEPPRVSRYTVQR